MELDVDESILLRWNLNNFIFVIQNYIKKRKYDAIMKLPVTTEITADKTQNIDKRRHPYGTWHQFKRIVFRVQAVKEVRCP
jgi:hypothetical protein